MIYFFLHHHPEVGLLKEALLYRRIKNNWVECRLCARRCKIPPGRRGFCNVRENKDGTLYTLVYGRVTAFNVDPIAKKPLFHVWPGAFVASISTTGCNFRCIFCDNWHLSQTSRLYGRPMSPEDIVTYAIKLGADGISYTYNEPTIFFEYMYDTAKLAKEKGLFNTIVTNGYMSAEATELFSKYLLAATVDFKGCANSDFYKKFCGVPD
ncbi:MAG: AmmeMemoRadiSam system radical SAM enzyme, partial [Thermoprotei archaeon]